MKLKVGDKVRIKNDLREYNTYGKERFMPEMSEYKNKVAIINKAVVNDKFIIDLDDGKWWWTEEMLDKLPEEENKMSKCKVYTMPNYVDSDVQKVIVNKPCVIVFLRTGEKGIAKCYPGDEFSEERGYMIAYKRATIERIKSELEHEECILKFCVDGDLF